MQPSCLLSGLSRSLRFVAVWTTFSLLVCMRLTAHQGAPPATPPAAPLANVKQLVLPPTDPQAELAKDAQKTAPGPLRFAVAQKVNVTPVTHGTWEQLPSGRLWRLRIISPGATDLNLGFTTYWLPEGATLYLISESQAYYQGPYTSEHNAEHGQLWTAVVPGQAAVLELFVPNGVQQDPTLVLGQVSTGYRDLFKLQKDGSTPKGDYCEIDVVCPVAAPWTNEIRSVACISIGGLDLCTATLVMDAAADFRPFLLTANHCEIGPGNASTVVAYWNYQSPTCGTAGMDVPVRTSWTQNTSGSSFRAARADTDFCLIELTQTPNSSYGVCYAGWDRSGIAPASGVGIHHPGGNGKCISFSNGGLTTTDNCISNGIATHWRVPWGSQGVTEPGSSGSGIWDASSHLVVGTLSGGESACGAASTNLWDCYGKFALAWNTGVTSTERLRDWLDPCNTGLLSVPGAYPTPRVAIAAAGATLLSESCLPTNGVVDPGETVTVSLALRNAGTLPTANLIGTLQSGNGVLAPSAPQTYGLLAANGASVSRSFSFTANGACGDTITAILQLQDGTSNYCTSFSFTLGKLTSGPLENFDTTDLFTLPAGWTEDPVGMNWYVLNTVADTPPNSVWSWDPPYVSDRSLISPPISIKNPNAQLTFRHNYDTEPMSDGGVLEISIAGAPFIDIEAAGGSFVAGGYVDTLLPSNNPLATRRAWTGNSGGFITTTVNLPPIAAGQNIQLKWRLGTDDSIDGNGWYVDTISLADGYDCCGGSSVASPTLTTLSYAPGQFQFKVTGSPGSNYAVEASTDLVNWVPLQTNSSPFTFTETNPGAYQTRFYRAVSKP